MSLVALYLLATVDGILLGHHAAIGQSPLVEKTSFWLRAFWRGLLVGQASLALIAVTTALVWLRTADRAGFVADAAIAARAMLWVFVPYAALVVASLGLWLTRARLLANVLVLGPFTLLRAPVLAIGVAAGVATRPRWEVAAVLLVALVSVGSLRPALRRLTPRWRSARARGARPGG